MATLTLFCGLPGSGKTTLAKVLEREGNGVRLCTDEWQTQLGRAHSDDEFHSRLQRRLYLFALELLAKDVDVILEDGLCTRPERIEKRNDAERVGARTHLHVFALGFEEVWNRLRQRNEGLRHDAVLIDREELRTFWDIFQPPDEAELSAFDRVTIHRFNTSRPSMSAQ